MHINCKHLSPNFDNKKMDVCFIVLHYTACSLKDSLAIFLDTKSKASAHYIIDIDGQIYNCVATDKVAWHAGHSKFCDIEKKEWQAFNNFSIGIELVNLNGNLFNYTNSQYQNLFLLIKKLQKQYPVLIDPNKILGHEHIAGFRGKADPGYFFDWKKLFSNCYEKKIHPSRKAIINNVLLKKYQKHLSLLKQKNIDINFKKFNLDLENNIRTILK